MELTSLPRNVHIEIPIEIYRLERVTTKSYTQSEQEMFTSHMMQRPEMIQYLNSVIILCRITLLACDKMHAPTEVSDYANT